MWWWWSASGWVGGYGLRWIGCLIERQPTSHTEASQRPNGRLMQGLNGTAGRQAGSERKQSDTTTTHDRIHTVQSPQVMPVVMIGAWHQPPVVAPQADPTIHGPNETMCILTRG
jgi:hypothetical protein